MQPQSSGRMPSGPWPPAGGTSLFSEGAIYISPNDSMLLSSRRSGLSNVPGMNNSSFNHDAARGGSVGVNSGVNPLGGSMKGSEISGSGSAKDGANGPVSGASSGNAQVCLLYVLKYCSVQQQI